MDVLILGGTGAMGVPLVKLLALRDNMRIYVTSRRKFENKDNVNYICGNAKDEDFFLTLMERNYDVIVDFMVYTTQEFENRIDILLNHTNQYFYFSSSRCYANSSNMIKETSLRLIDSCDDREYLLTDEYALAKGREENILFNNKKKNWTIIRPYITYNSNRIQLGVYEKEDWLRRALAGRTVVFPKDIAEKYTTLTYGPDVAAVIAMLIGNKKAYGEVFHVTTSETHTWKEIMDFYCNYLKEKTGKTIKVKYVDDSLELQKVWGNRWQIKYDRLFNRKFDNSKIEKITNDYKFMPLFEGLQRSLDKFLINQNFLNKINIGYEAWCDSLNGEYTPIKSISSKRDKIRYIKHRFIK